MKTASFPPTINDATRERVIIGVCALVAIAFGIVAATGSSELTAALFTVLLFSTAAFILPRAWLGIVLIALIPLQFYFPITASFYLRGALVFVLAAMLRVVLLRPSSFVLRPLSWLLPAALFLAAAFIAALGATNRYLALKGIFDWLPVFAAAFVIGETMPPRWLKRFIVALVTVGVLEALLGLLQTRFTPAQIAEVLQIPSSHWFYQPNLLRERLAEFSFNWLAGNRVLPFGTFINGIDYALFLAAMLGLASAWLMQEAGGRRQEAGSGDCLPPTASRLLLTAYCLLSIALIGIALLLTYKGSGLLALAGAGAVLVWALGVTRATASRLLPPASRLLPTASWLLAGVLLLGIVFFEPLVQRGAFLIQRESSASYETGRLEIWRQALAALPQRPFFGFGLNNAGQLIAPTQSLRGGTFIVNANAPESAYVATLVETGIIGFAALLWFIGAVLVRAYQRARASLLYAGVLAAIVALLCGNLTVNGLTTDQNGLLLGVLIGMVFADNERTHV